MTTTTTTRSPSADWLPLWFADHVRPVPAHPVAITVDAETVILVLMERGAPAPLPARWLWDYQQVSRYCDRYSAQPLKIRRLPDCELVQMDTNFISGHRITVSPQTALRTWDGGLIEASEVKSGTQLIGQYGMYVVTQRRKIVAPWAYQGNFTSVGGIYVGLDT